MSAQYRPYRDEDSVDGLEAAAWSDNEPGTIQIYEKTTEELPFSSNNKKVSWIHIALIIGTGVLGFLLGYFINQKDFITHFEHDAAQQLETNFSHEDPTIKIKLLKQIDGHRILSLLEKYEDTNRMPGSESDHEFALHIQDLFTEFRFDSITATNFTFKTMLPKQPSVVKLLDVDNKTLYSNIDHEHYPHDDMRPFLPLSQAEAATMVSDKIIYVNKGTKEDYTKLSSLGITSTELEGKILVIRQTFYQAHEIVIGAQESGAMAILLFPDPDTYGSSSPFPKKLQLRTDAGRSHPTAWSNYGDLASFNLSSTGIDVSKLGLDKDSKVTIPVVLISHDTASKILRGLSGTPAPSEWNCFDFTLYLGPGYREENNEDKRNKIMIEFHNQETSVISTTITGTISGSVEPDRYVVIGSRRDSLNRGLLDSVSGSAVMLEIARAYSELLKQNWRPKRTIVFSSFGAESLNLIGSSHWLEDHQRLLHSRAVAYVNCDQVVTGNLSAAIAASPLLFQVLYNSTKQVTNPNLGAENAYLPSVYDVWKENNQRNQSKNQRDTNFEKILEENELEARLTKSAMASIDQGDAGDDSLGESGSFLHEYKKSAIIRARPKVRKLDLQSIYSPFFLYAGIPVVDVRYAGFSSATPTHKMEHLLEETLPVIGTKYDNLEAIQLIDPHLKYHVTVAQILSEIIRDLSDSVFLPFNLLEYAVTLHDSFSNFEAHYGPTFNKSDVELVPLKEIIEEFTRTAIRFHHRQDQVSLKDVIQVRKINDQLMQLERCFLDSNSYTNHWDRKHIILSPNDGQEHHEGFPGLVDWITLLEGENLDQGDQSIFVSILKVHYKLVIYTISNAIKIIDEVYIL